MAMLQRKYKNAILIGAAIGVVAIMSAAEQSFSPFTENLAGGGMYIPGWDGYRDFTPSLSLDLKHQAVLLRFCQIIVEDGFTYLMIPCLIVLAWTKLDDLGKRNGILFCLSRSLLVTFLGTSCVTFVMAVLGIWDPTIGCLTVEGHVLNTWHRFLEYSFSACFSPIVYVVWLLFFGICSIFTNSETPQKAHSS
ncbi:MAG: hypothetical protein C0507_06420 [Cyanobacteria bacterium PR.3.49]|nr:hypothetical protein [Cyanobacteria bacterium PR.3.49]